MVNTWASWFRKFRTTASFAALVTSWQYRMRNCCHVNIDGLSWRLQVLWTFRRHNNSCISSILPDAGCSTDGRSSLAAGTFTDVLFTIWWISSVVNWTISAPECIKLGIVSDSLSAGLVDELTASKVNTMSPVAIKTGPWRAVCKFQSGSAVRFVTGSSDDLLTSIWSWFISIGKVDGGNDDNSASGCRLVAKSESCEANKPVSADNWIVDEMFHSCSAGVLSSVILSEAENNINQKFYIHQKVDTAAFAACQEILTGNRPGYAYIFNKQIHLKG